MQLVLDSHGLIVKKRNACFWIVSPTHKKQISPNRVTSIAVLADCLMSTAAIRLAATHSIPVYFYSFSGRLEAKLWGPTFGSIATIRRKQALFERTVAATAWVQSLFEQKLAAQVTFLKKTARKYPAKQVQMATAMQQMQQLSEGFDACTDQLISDCRQTLMGVEGQVARVYWKTLGELIPQNLNFKGRTRRPALDPFNASLNYLYGMLYGTTSMAIVAAGLDTHLGFLHVDEYARPAFTFDLIEPFRPWVDELLLDASLNGALTENLFTQQEGGFVLNKAGKQVIIPMFNGFLEEKILFQGKHLSRKNHLYRYAGEFAQYLLSLEP